tara:strand:- start:8471 stop:10024 length:1554 start_codon:yes stop_codon:yes gene_type:complete
MDPSMGVGPTVLASLANFAAHVQHISPLRPDLYGEGGSLTDLEDDFARVLGKDACVTVLTGTLAHVVATRVHADDCQNVGRVALHATSSLLLSDLRPLENAWGFSPAVYGRAHRCASFADVSAVLSHKLKVATVILEVPQWATGGTVTPMEELEAIAVLCRHKRVRLHLDGSRLMHALPALGLSSAAEICCLFDSVYLSARDNFGALGGGFLAGTRRFVENARLWIKRLGACPPTLLPYEASIRKAVMRAEISPRSFHNRASRLRDACALITSQLIMRGAPIRLDPPVPQTTVVHVYLRGYTEEVKDAISRAEAASGVRLSDGRTSVMMGEVELGSQRATKASTAATSQCEGTLCRSTHLCGLVRTSKPPDITTLAPHCTRTCARWEPVVALGRIQTRHTPASASKAERRGLIGLWEEATPSCPQALWKSPREGGASAKACLAARRDWDSEAEQRAASPLPAPAARGGQASGSEDARGGDEGEECSSADADTPAAGPAASSRPTVTQSSAEPPPKQV